MIIGIRVEKEGKDMRCKIIFEDTHIVVCHKPAGFPTQTGQVGRADCVSELKNYLNAKGKKTGAPYLGVVHRLDQPVEGLLVFAKTKEAAAGLSKQLESGLLNKRYYAVVNGIPPIRDCAGEEAGVVAENERWMKLENYMEKDSRLSMAKILPAKGEDAVVAKLQYRVMKQEMEKQIAEVEVILETGRFHQIRAQLANLGYPLLGDQKYGNGESIGKSQQYAVKNVALCAYSLDLEHPVTKERMGFVCRPENVAFSLLS